MYQDQPLSLKQILPAWLRVEEFYVGVACATFMVVAFALYSNFGPRGRTQAKIKNIQERRQDLRGEMVGAKRRRRKPEASVNFMRSVAMKFELVKKLQVGKAESTLIEAGLRSKDAIFIMAFFIMTLPIVLGVAGLIAMKLNDDISEKWRMINYMWPLLGAYIGFKLPWIYVKRLRKKRYIKIQRSLSDVLDLMTICAEAGLSLAASLERVSRELRFTYPEMAEELALTAVEMGFLPDRNKALTNLSERCQLPEVRGITSVLVQTEKYGTPIAQALRVLSAEFRQARMLRAEQKAARLPAIMTVPMICFILPTLFIIIIAPAAIKIMNTLK